MMIYLDANASEPIRPAALAASHDAATHGGNPSSVHAAGRAARRVLEEAREAVATAFGGEPAQTVFTSGGTEANWLAVAGLRSGRRVIAGATEHPCILATDPDTLCPVHPDGRFDPDALETLLADGGPALVCLMLANHETGVLHPIAEAAALCRRHGALLHVDAVQAAGRLPVSLAALGATSLALSGHKLGGLPGAGALLLAPDAPLAAPMAGGGQERGRRGGTPALPAIAGMAAAAREALTAADRLAGLRDRIEAAAIRAGAHAVGADAPRLPNTTCLVLPGTRADTQVIALDLAGFAVSAGAACSSGKVSASPVLAAMGFGAASGQAIRVSLPWSATDTDADAFIAAYAGMAERLSVPAAA